MGDGAVYVSADLLHELKLSNQILAIVGYG